MKRVVTGDATERIVRLRVGDREPAERSRGDIPPIRYAWFWIAWVAASVALAGAVAIAR